MSTRVRKANEQAIQTTIDYLKNIKHSIDTTGEPDLVRLSRVHKTTSLSAKAIKEMKFVVYEGGKWKMRIDPEKFGRQMALEILDHNLQYNKKWTNPEIIPSTETLIRVLGEVSEKLSVTISQNNIALNQTKRGVRHESENLFSKEEQSHRDRVYISGQIIGGVYSGIMVMDDGVIQIKMSNIKTTNEAIVKITEDLLTQLEAKRDGK